jgi:uncharacterized membrane protein YkvA (DUF1232 family)
MDMDKELDQYFEDFDFLPPTNEEQYRANAAMVREQFEDKMRRNASKLRFGQDLIALFRYFMDPHVGWQKKTIVVAALLYFILPIDSIPDLMPVIGYLDDFGVILAVTSFMSKELQPYYPVVADEAEGDQTNADIEDAIGL